LQAFKNASWQQFVLCHVPLLLSQCDTDYDNSGNHQSTHISVICLSLSLSENCAAVTTLAQIADMLSFHFEPISKSVYHRRIKWRVNLNFSNREQESYSYAFSMVELLLALKKTPHTTPDTVHNKITHLLE
jgi:hypothetical protein